MTTSWLPVFRSRRPALAARGVPDMIYVDNGSAFVDSWLLRACARLGIKLAHSTPGRPQGSGRSSGCSARSGRSSWWRSPAPARRAAARWSPSANERHERGKTPIIVLDETHLLSHQQLEAVRMLTDHDIDSRSTTAVLLIGQPTLKRQMRLGVLAALEQRILLRYTMTGMTAAETDDYIRHHTGLAGRSDTLFSDDAVSLIHETGRGPSPIGEQDRRHRADGRLCGEQGHRRRVVGPRRDHRTGDRLTTMPMMEECETVCVHCGNPIRYEFDITGESRAFIVNCSTCGKPVVADLTKLFTGDVGIGHVTVEALRSAIQQSSDLGYWLPRALDVLREHPMVAGDLHEGDLLSAVVAREPEVWSTFPELARDLRLIISALVDLPPHIRQDVERFLGVAKGELS